MSKYVFYTTIGMLNFIAMNFTLVPPVTYGSIFVFFLCMLNTILFLRRSHVVLKEFANTEASTKSDSRSDTE